MSQKSIQLSVPIDCSQRGVMTLVYEKYGRAALSKLCHVVGREDVARELLQEVFVRIWQRSPLFDSEQMLYGWIYRSCHNAGIDYLRSAVARREGPEMSQEDEDYHDQGSAVGRIADRSLIRALMVGMSSRDAAILGYVAIDEMTHDEAAEMLGISKKTVTRTMIRLRLSLEAKRSTL